MEQKNKNLEEEFDYIVFYDGGRNKFIVVCNQSIVNFIWATRFGNKPINKKFSPRRLKIILSRFYKMRGIIILRKISYKEAVEKLKKAHPTSSMSYWYGVNMRV